MVDIVAVDIGNSSIKLAAISRLGEAVNCRLDEDFTAKDIAEFVANAGLTDPTWYTCSVNDVARQKFIDTAGSSATESSAKSTNFFALNHTHVPLQKAVEAAEKVGMDRLVAAWSARERFDDETLIVVDAGTAVTIDVTVGQRFEGGLIFPGPTTALEALSSQTDALPALAEHWTAVASDSAAEIRIGTDSEPAILLGVHQHFLCGLETIVNRLASQHPGSKVVCTGGILEPCIKNLPTSWEHLPGLVLEGILSIAKRLASKE